MQVAHIFILKLLSSLIKAEVQTKDGIHGAVLESLQETAKNPFVWLGYETNFVSSSKK